MRLNELKFMNTEENNNEKRKKKNYTIDEQK